MVEKREEVTSISASDKVVKVLLWTLHFVEHEFKNKILYYDDLKMSTLLMFMLDDIQ